MESNQFHRFLNLPVTLGGSVMEFCTKNNISPEIKNIPAQAKLWDEYFPAEFHSWLASNGLQMRNAELFVTPAHSPFPIHSDVVELDQNVAKINFVDGSDQSFMNWYSPINRELIRSNITSIGTGYLEIDSDNAELLYRVSITKPSLVNAGKFHNVTNDTDQIRWCVSLPLYYLGTKDRVQFNEALDIFKDYIQ